MTEITQGNDDLYENFLQVTNQFSLMKSLVSNYDVNI